MINSLRLIKKEHIRIREILSRIDGCMNGGKVNHLNAMKELEDLKGIWDAHERREENLFYFFQQLGRPFPVETMFLGQHKQLRGHLKVLQDAIYSKDLNKFEVALDTDGRMLIEKIRKHTKNEDRFFDQFVLKGEKSADLEK